MVGDGFPRGPAHLDSASQPDYHVPVPSALESLSSVPLFANLTPRQLRKVARNASEDSYAAGSSIVTEGGRTETLFVVSFRSFQASGSNRAVKCLSWGACSTIL